MTAPDHVEAAIDRDWTERGRTEDEYIARQEAAPLNVVPLRPGWLDVRTVLGATDYCCDCGMYIPVCEVATGKHLRECPDCRLVMEGLDDG